MITKKELRPVVNSMIKKIITDTIAVNELPQPYKTGLTIMRKEIVDYILNNFKRNPR